MRIKRATVVFRLQIEMGNDAMQSRDDVALALKQLARRTDFDRNDAGKIRDANGNTVGEWGFHEEE